MGLFERLRPSRPVPAGSNEGDREAGRQEALRLIDEGNALEDKGRSGEAMSRYESAVRLAPNLARAHLNRGNILLAMGDTQGALDAFATALVKNPEYAAAHFNMGNAHLRAGRRDAALAAYRNALALKPDFTDAEVALGCALEELGQREEAAASYRRALEINPDYAEVHCNLGNVLRGIGKLDDAAASYRRALEIKPELAVAHCALGNTLQDLGQLGDASASYRRALSIHPDYVEALHNLGNTLQRLGQADAAAASYRQALQIEPGAYATHFNLGNVLRELGQFDDAVASYRRALEINANLPDAHCNLGNVLKELGQRDPAVASYRRALDLRPDFAEAHCNLGTVLQDLGQLDAAVASYRRALAIKPDFPEAHYNLGSGLTALGQLESGVASYRQALLLNPDYAAAHSNLGNALVQLGRLDEALPSYRRTLEIWPDFAKTYTNLLFALNYSASHSTSDCLEEARRYGQQVVGKSVGSRYTAWSCARNPKRLRVGLVSGDLRSHPVGYFLEGLLSQIDPAQLELFAYPTYDQADELTAVIRRHVAAWKPLFGQSDEAAARLIHADGVHVLLDLSGHTAENRLPVFGWKPAPVQCTWLGYFATTGVAEMDYLLGDPYVTPTEEAGHFTERLWQLPERYICFTPPAVPLPVGPLPALSSGHITFGCFNNLAKMNDAVVTLWATVLQAVPDSRLFLKAAQLNDALVCEQIRRKFAARGVAADRLSLEGSSSRREYLASYNRVDIALDPFPYPGGTTSVEALWMGVPFITRRGDRFVSHMGESIAHNAGLAGWIALDDDDYLAKARTFAANLDQLAALRAGLRSQVLASPVFDAPRFARNFEAALWGMWKSWQARQGT